MRRAETGGEFSPTSSRSLLGGCEYDARDRDGVLDRKGWCVLPNPPDMDCKIGRRCSHGPGAPQLVDGVRVTDSAACPVNMCRELAKHLVQKSHLQQVLNWLARVAHETVKSEEGMQEAGAPEDDDADSMRDGQEDAGVDGQTLIWRNPQTPLVGLFLRTVDGGSRHCLPVLVNEAASEDRLLGYCNRSCLAAAAGSMDSFLWNAADDSC